MPAVDQQVVEVDRREVDNDVVSPLPIITWSTAAMLFSFIKLKQTSFTRKENMKTVIYSIYMEMREPSSQEGLT